MQNDSAIQNQIPVKTPLSPLDAAVAAVIGWAKSRESWPPSALGLIDIVTTGLRDFGFEIPALDGEPNGAWVEAFYTAVGGVERVTLDDGSAAFVRGAVDAVKRQGTYHRTVVERVAGNLDQLSEKWGDATKNTVLRISFAELLSHLAVAFAGRGRVPHCHAAGRALLRGAVAHLGPQGYRPERPPYRYVGDMVAEVQLGMGVPLFVDTGDDSVCRDLIRTGWWEPWIHSVVTKCVGPGDICVNVGANVGYYTVLMGKCVGHSGRVFAFEPNPRLARLLRRSLRWGGLTGTTTLLALAASNAKGKATFLVDPDQLGGGGMLRKELDESVLGIARERATLNTAQDGGQNPGPQAVRRGLTPLFEAFDVQTVTLDEAIGARTERIHFMLIDAEGAEPLVLEGARELIRRSPDLAMVVEWSNGEVHTNTAEQRTRASETIEWLVRDGFRFWTIGPDSADFYARPAILQPVSPESVIGMKGLCDLFVCRQELRG